MTNFINYRNALIGTLLASAVYGTPGFAGDKNSADQNPSDDQKPAVPVIRSLPVGEDPVAVAPPVDAWQRLIGKINLEARRVQRRGVSLKGETVVNAEDAAPLCDFLNVVGGVLQTAVDDAARTASASPSSQPEVVPEGAASGHANAASPARPLSHYEAKLAGRKA